MKTIGILGGLGPQTTSEFFLELIRLGTTSSRPPVCIWSLPLNLRKEAEHIATGAHADHFRSLLRDGTRRLNRAGAEHIVIPCNTVHEFHPELARISRAPLANIISLTVDEAQRRGWTKALLLATSQTLRQQLFQRAFSGTDVQLITPSDDDQRQLDALIQRVLRVGATPHDRTFLSRLRSASGTAHTILGCTDLQLLVQPSANVIDSMHVLAEHAARVARGEQ